MGTLSENRQARFDYDIAETYAAGVVLTGHETKSAKLGRMDLAGSRAVVRGGEAYLVGASIHSFQPGNAPDGYDATRTRKLLLSHAEIKYLTGKLESGLTLVPVKVYTHRALVKIELGLGRVRKKHDKREVIKKRETEREMRRAG
ncbi:MAG: SsrA-binding protein SmpB [Candidatus Brennerbacteria bacterium]|nr:SsrA-binding protein SmpB [Candidatus Brennerbacteria bacterium]